ncbi:hypothetical protein AAEH90_04635 [Shewanella algae]|uniref:hypothetical protein n=1 Tax=Shewanella algae TaxID=38313 RepID=UPI00313D8D97
MKQNQFNDHFKSKQIRFWMDQDLVKLAGELSKQRGETFGDTMNYILRAVLVTNEKIKRNK